MIQAGPYIIIGVFGSIALALYIAGCAATGVWWAMFTVIHAALACIFAISYITKFHDSTFTHDYVCEVFTIDSLLFCLVFCFLSSIAFVTVLWHCTVVNYDCLWCVFGGDLSTFIGFVAFIHYYKKTRIEFY